MQVCLLFQEKSPLKAGVTVTSSHFVFLELIFFSSTFLLVTSQFGSLQLLSCSIIQSSPIRTSLVMIMASSAVGCGRCGYSHCLCLTTRPPTDLFFAIPKGNATPGEKPVYANELDGLQAGLDYLEKLDNPTDARFLQRGMQDELDDELCDIPIPDLLHGHWRTPSLRETPDRYRAKIHLCYHTTRAGMACTRAKRGRNCLNARGIHHCAVST